jgi:DNA-binding HxlR family transcriptional regulator
MKKLKKRSECPISSLLDIVGDKWSLLIIRDLIFSGKESYGDFLKSDEKIATNILADRLEMLEMAGMITKKEHPENKVKYIYRLTRQGIDLLPILLEMVLWSDKYLAISAQSKELAKQLRKNKEAVTKQIAHNLKKG